MEMKWVMIMASVAFASMFAGIGFSESAKSQCRLKGIEAKMPADEIAKVCR